MYNNAGSEHGGFLFQTVYLLSILSLAIDCIF